MAQGWGCSLNLILWFSFHNVLALYLRGHALEQEMFPTSSLTTLLLSFLFTHLSLYSHASPALPHQDPHLSPYFLLTLQPLFGKGVFF